jgi:lysophospholipase L1-like esterase
MKLNKPGIFLFISSLVISLFILEIGFRTAGFVFNESRTKIYYAKDKNLDLKYDGERDYEQFFLAENSKEIWAIGDSFTNAGNVESDESYPAYLFRLLESKSYNYNVLNLGQCEDPTWGVLARLKAQLELGKRPPETVIVLAGSSDPFYQLYGVEDYNMKDKGDQKLVRFQGKEKYWFESLRIFKAYRHIKLSLQSLSISKASDQLSEEEFSSLGLLYNNAVVIHKNKVESWGELEEEVFKLLSAHRSLLDGSNLNGNNYEFKFQDKPRFVFNTLVMPRIRVYSGRLDHVAALELLLKFSIDFPEYFWNKQRNDPFAFNLLSQLFRFQSKLTSKDIQASFELSTSTNKKLKKLEFYKIALKSINSISTQEKEIRKSRRLAWQGIVKLAHENNFKLVIQNYGSSFTSANQMALDISREHSLPFVDNHKKFGELSDKYGRAHLFADDSHFVPFGYELMAKNVLKVLEAEKLISID